MDKNAASVFRERKNYILVQQVERRWSNATTNNQLNGDSVLNDNRKSSSSSRRGTNRSSYQHQRTKSLCVFYNGTSILNYARAMGANDAKRASNANATNSKEILTPKDMKILQYHEKIMEVQNRWTGNGKFIIREKSTFLVTLH